MSWKKSLTAASIALLFNFGVARAICAQEAASTPAATSPAPSPTPDLLIPAQSDLPGTEPPVAGPESIPELSQLDDAFKRSSLGKTADEARLRVEAREIKNRVSREPDLVAAFNAANSAATDLEKREQLRSYYELFYGRMRAAAGSEALKKFLETERDAHIANLNQPRVRPMPGVSVTPVPKHKRKKEKSDPLSKR